MDNKSKSVWGHPAGKIFIGICLWNLVAYGLLFNSFSLFVKPIAGANHFSIAAVSLIGSIMALIGGIFLNFTGRLMNKVSSRTWFTLVAIGLVLVNFGLSQATVLWQFYTLGCLYGILAGLGIFVTAPLVIPNWFAYSGTYLGVAAGCGGLGGVIAAPIVSYFITLGGYSAGFKFSAVVTLIVLVPLGLFVLKFRPAEIGAKSYDIERFEAERASTQVAAAAEGEQVFNGYTEAEARKMPQWWLLWLFVALVPMLNAVFMHVPGTLADKGLSVIVAGSVVSSYQFGVMLGQMIIGWFSDRLGVAGTVFLWAAAAVVTALGLALYNQPTVWLLAVLVFLLGVIRALTTVGLPVVVKHLFGMKEYSKIFTTYYTLIMICGALYITVMGWLKDVTGSYNIIFLIIAGVAAIALVILMIVLSLGKKQEKRRLSGEWKSAGK
jgi:sugar phosphate permease